MIRTLDIRTNLTELKNQDNLKINNLPKEMADVFSKIQIGDFLKGQVILNQDKNMLALENGMYLLAALEEEVETNQLLEFVVTGKENGKIFLKPSDSSENNKQQVSFSQQVIEALKLKDEPEMKVMIEQFMSKQLPLVKNQLTQFFCLSKAYEFPGEALVNLADQNQPVKETELNMLQQIKQEGMKAVYSLLADVVEMTDKEKCSLMFLNLSELLGEEELGLLLFEESELFQTADKENQTIAGEKLQNWLKDFSHKDIKRLCKSAVSRLLTVNVENLKAAGNNEMEKITEMAARLKQIAESIKEHTGENDKAVFKLEEGIQIMEKYNQEAQYFCFPLTINHKETAGELYFFKPKKNKLNDNKGMYIVLALNLPALKKVEVHLIEKKDKVHLKLKVSSEEIRQMFETYEEKIINELNEGITAIEKIEYDLLTKAVEVQQEISHFNHMDFKV